MDYLNIALPKGRLGEKVYDMFERIGYGCPAIREKNRSLIFENHENKVRYFWSKPSDVAIMSSAVRQISVLSVRIFFSNMSPIYTSFSI